MSRGVAALGILLLLTASSWFAYMNGSERVTLRFGFATLYQVPLIYLVFAALLLGMLVMLLTGIHTDLKVRRFLRERLAEEDREEKRRFVDTNQRDLFSSEER